ncbi:MAG: DUF1398 domain-containing protein [Bacteroidota bacterium]|nr:DUF1398 domain-containing protein [Bacteroidota bacterium]
MFQLEEIKEAHSKVKSGADFPKYIQDLLKLGVTKYDTFVSDGHTSFVGENNYRVQSEPKYSTLEVADISDAEKFKQYLKIHQQGQTNYPTFCNHSAETGVEKWTVDMNQMTCIYYDKSNNQMLEEKIPAL